MRCRVLGPIEVRGEAGWTRLRGQQAMLVAHLVAAHPDPVAFGVLETAFWGEQPPSKPDTALKVAVARLRKTFGEDLVEHTAAGYVLRAAPETLDVQVFERLAAEAATLAVGGRLAAALDRAEAALGCWHGSPFATVVDSLTLTPTIHTLDEVRTATEELAVDLLIGLDRLDRAAAEASRLTTAEPLRERRWEQLMASLHLSGRSVEALRVFQQFRDLLADEVGLGPGSSITELDASIAADGEIARWLRFDRAFSGARNDPEPAGSSADNDAGFDIADPARELAPSIASPPRPTTSFIDRSDDLDAVASAVEASRLVTVVGPPGVGKTRLVHAFTTGLDEDRVGWIDLAVEQPGAAGEAVLGAFGSAGERLGGVDVVVLDNAEHVVDEVVASLEVVLVSGWQGSVVVTSRVPLGVPAERVVRLSPMDSDQSMRLLRARSGAASHLSDDAAAALVRAVDGLPLAIELAARRLDDEPVDAVAASVRMGDVIADVDRLDVADRGFFVALGSMTGSFDAAAAAHVAGCSERAGEAALRRLVAASIVQRVPARLATRYRLLEPLRQVAARLADDVGRAFELRRRHVEFHAARAIERATGLLTHDEERAVDQLELDAPQIRTAWRHAVDDGDADRASMLASAWWWMTLRSLSHRDYARPFATLDVPGFGESPWRVDVLASAAMAEWARGRFRTSIDCGERALAVAEQLDVAVPLDARLGLIASYSLRGRNDEAHEQMLALIAEAQQREAWYHLAGAQSQIAMSFANMAMPDEARSQAQAALDSAERSENTSTLAFARQAMAVTLADADPARALSEAYESIRLATRVGNRWLGGWTTATIANLYRRLGRNDEAAVKLDGLLGHWQALAMEPQLVHSVLESALLFDAIGDRPGVELALTIANDGRPHHPMTAAERQAVAALRAAIPTPPPDRPEADLVAELRDRLGALHGV